MPILILAMAAAVFSLAASKNYWPYAMTLCLGLWVGGAIYWRSEVRVWPQIVYVIMVALLLIVNSAWLTGSKMEADNSIASALLFLFVLCPAGIAMGVLMSNMRIDFAKCFFICQTFVGGVISALGLYLGNAFLGEERYQIAGNMVANGAVACLMLIPLATKQWRKWTLASMLVLCVIGIGNFGARQSALALLVAALVIASAHAFSRTGRRGYGRGLGIGIISLMMAIFITNEFDGSSSPVPLFDRISAHMGDTRDSTNSRAYLQSIAFDRFEVESPMGIGTGRLVNNVMGEAGTGPHNIFIEGLVEQGWLGAILIFTFPIIVLYKSMRFWWSSPCSPDLCIFPVLLCSLVYASCSGDLPTSRFFWPALLCASVVVSAHIAFRRRERMGSGGKLNEESRTRCELPIQAGKMSRT